MAKINRKPEKPNLFGGIIHVKALFSRHAGSVIDKELDLCCTSFDYQYGKIIGSLSSVYFCSINCVEDATIHLIPHLISNGLIGISDF